MNKNHKIIVHKSVWDENLTTFMLMEAEGRGAAMLSIFGDEAIHFEKHDVYITDLNVDENYRGLGIATALVKEALKHVPAGKQLATNVIDNAPDWHIKFYEKLGVAIDNLDTYNEYDDGID